jgi:hypothetical protein
MTTDELSLKMFGRSCTLAFAARQCVACGGSADYFKDELSVKEYFISTLCQDCQDAVFVEDPLANETDAV